MRSARSPAITVYPSRFSGATTPRTRRYEPPAREPGVTRLASVGVLDEAVAEALD